MPTKQIMNNLGVSFAFNTENKICQVKNVSVN